MSTGRTPWEAVSAESGERAERIGGDGVVRILHIPWVLDPGQQITLQAGQLAPDAMPGSGERMEQRGAVVREQAV